MYYLYLTICCLLSMQSSTSYVLLAANIEDFRSLAERFAPASLADQIFALATDAQDKTKQEDTEESAHTSEDDETQRPREQPVNRGHQIKRNSKDSPYDLHIDDLVARVKERLQQELTMMATGNYGLGSDNEHTTTEESNTMKKQADKGYAQKGRETHYVKRPNLAGQEKEPRDEDNYEDEDRNVGHERYVEPKHQDSRDSEADVASPSKYLEQKKRIPKPRPDPPKRQRRESTPRDSIQHDRKIIRPKQTTNEIEPETTTANILEDFHGIDMANDKDSYEDYVTPKKEPYEERSPQYSHKKHSDNHELFTDDDQVQTTEPNDYDRNPEISEENDNFTNNKKTTEFINDDLTTTEPEKPINIQRLTVDKPAPHKNARLQPRNKKLKVSKSIQLLPTKNPNRPIPYAEQLALNNEYSDETVGTTEEVKARTERMSFNEKPTVQPDLQLYNLSNPNHLHGLKTKKIPKAGTVIPKRDFYKMTSPNYVAKLPKVAESYKFEEPIPEADREPEKLSPIGNPPASINGKIKLT